MKATVQGRSAYVHTGGMAMDRSLPAVVLIHGAGQDHTLWRFQTRTLAHRGTTAAAAVDLPGHGRSEGPAPASIGEMARWIGDVLDVLSVESVVLVGHSMGSFVSLETVASGDSRVRGLVLSGTASAMAVHPDLMSAARDQDRLAADLIGGWTHSGPTKFGGSAQPGMWERGVTERVLERNDEALGIDLAACAAYDASARASHVHVPATVVVGSADRMTRPDLARALAVRLDHATLLELAEAGHDLVVERPRQLVDAIEKLVARVFG